MIKCLNTDSVNAPCYAIDAGFVHRPSPEMSFITAHQQIEPARTYGINGTTGDHSS